MTSSGSYSRTLVDDAILSLINSCGRKYTVVMATRSATVFAYKTLQHAYHILTHISQHLLNKITGEHFLTFHQQTKHVYYKKNHETPQRHLAARH